MRQAMHNIDLIDLGLIAVFYGANFLDLDCAPRLPG
jgi:hypothetical protein